jgi:hypothetical protein
MTIGYHAKGSIDFDFVELRFTPVLRLPRPHGERRKSIDSAWGWGKSIDFQAILNLLFMIPDSHNIL